MIFGGFCQIFRFGLSSFRSTKLLEAKTKSLAKTTQKYSGDLPLQLIELNKR